MVLSDLVREYGSVTTVRDFETWQDVKAYGTYQLGNKHYELWTYNGTLFRLCLYMLPPVEYKKVMEAYSTSKF